MRTPRRHRPDVDAAMAAAGDAMCATRGGRIVPTAARRRWGFPVGGGGKFVCRTIARVAGSPNVVRVEMMMCCC